MKNFNLGNGIKAFGICLWFFNLSHGQYSFSEPAFNVRFIAPVGWTGQAGSCEPGCDMYKSYDLSNSNYEIGWHRVDLHVGLSILSTRYFMGQEVFREMTHALNLIEENLGQDLSIELFTAIDSQYLFTENDSLWAEYVVAGYAVQYEADYVIVKLGVSHENYSFLYSYGTTISDYNENKDVYYNNFLGLDFINRNKTRINTSLRKKGGTIKGNKRKLKIYDVLGRIPRTPDKKILFSERPETPEPINIR